MSQASTIFDIGCLLVSEAKGAVVALNGTCEDYNYHMWCAEILELTKNGAFSWVTRPKPVRVIGLPNLREKITKAVR